ncbi:MAG: hypothetical protein IJ574_05515 [Bacilli bacterium]|nr:hypothetical protein [Bacilli bacterium]
MKNKKVLVIVIVLLLVVVILGASYALWTTTAHQDGNNSAALSCLDITYESISENNIELNEVLPITDEAGLALEGYTFKITNNCNSIVRYQVNLETLNISNDTKYLNIDYLDATIDNEFIETLGNYESTTTLLSDNEARDARIIKEGLLDKSSNTSTNSVIHTLRVWLDKDTPTSEKYAQWRGKITINATTPTEDIIYDTAANYLTNVVKPTTDELVYDGASYTDPDTGVEIVDNNLRYVGANPDNYVWFNNELWRIIGVMNHVKGGENAPSEGETRLKLIRDESLGNFPYYEDCLEENMNYDAQTDKWTCSSKRYNNNWPNSTANEILNDLYWNRRPHAPYNGYMYLKTGNQTSFTWQDYKTEAVDFRNSGLKKVYQNMMETATYYLGGYTWDNGGTYDGVTMNTKQYYTAERTNQGINNELTWAGNLGLMYPSDYGYASSGSVSGSSCRNIVLSTWSQAANANCRNNNWLFSSAFWQWTMTLRVDYTINVADVSISGNVSHDNTHIGFGLRPVAYLKSQVKIIGGIGSSDNPYRLSL